jgi:SAM-dependent methyltransferase
LSSGENQSVYTESYFAYEALHSNDAAQCIVPHLLRLVNPCSVVDVGCGVGSWLREFNKAGVSDVMGIDFDVPRSMLQFPADRFLRMDLKEPFRLRRTFDLVLCMEVAEHLPPSSARALVDSLVALGPVIAFSAAIPYQIGGRDHVNERWTEYWNSLFESEGYEAFDCIRRRVWLNRKVPYWYSQNLVVFVSKRDLRRYPKVESSRKDTNRSGLSLVSPRMFVHWTTVIIRHRDFSEMFGTWILLMARSLRYTLSAIASRADKGIHEGAG